MTTQEIIEGTIEVEVRRWRTLETLYAERQRIGIHPTAQSALDLHTVQKQIRQLEALDAPEAGQ